MYEKNILTFCLGSVIINVKELIMLCKFYIECLVYALIYLVEFGKEGGICLFVKSMEQFEKVYFCTQHVFLL